MPRNILPGIPFDTFKPIDGHLYSGVVTITPTMAAILLEQCQRANRRINKHVVARFSRIMSQNGWMQNGEGLIFSKTKKLMDGRHRLTACVDSGVPFKTKITVGVEDTDAVMATINTGAPRSGSQILDMAGYTNSTILSAMADVVFRYENGTTTDYAIDALTRLQVLEANPDMVEYVGPAQRATKVFRHFPAGCFAGLNYLFSKANARDAVIFTESFIEGTGLELGMPVAALRKTAERAAQERGRIAQGKWVQLIIKAWNATQAGEEIRMLKLAPSQPSFLDITGLPRAVHDDVPLVNAKGNALKPRRTVEEPSVPAIITPRIVRAWAAANGYDVSAGGPVPRAIISAFEVANNKVA